MHCRARHTKASCRRGGNWACCRRSARRSSCRISKAGASQRGQYPVVPGRDPAARAGAGRHRFHGQWRHRASAESSAHPHRSRGRRFAAIPAYGPCGKIFVPLPGAPASSLHRRCSTGWCCRWRCLEIRHDERLADLRQQAQFPPRLPTGFRMPAPAVHWTRSVSGSPRVSSGYRAQGPHFRSYECEISDEDVTAQWNQHRPRHTVRGNQPHDRREHRAADNAHHDHRTAQFGVRSKFLQTQAKMVGNISDMKKLVRKMDHRPTQPG